MTDGARQCTAQSKHTGERCKRSAVHGKTVCAVHGAGGGAPDGNLNAIVHGAYVRRVLDEEEQQIYDAFLEQLREDFTLNGSSDEAAAHMTAISLLQFMRASTAGKESAAETHARIFRNNLKDLKATKITREGATPECKTTPAEWASALVAKARAADEKAKRKKTRRKTESK